MILSLLCTQLPAGQHVLSTPTMRNHTGSKAVPLKHFPCILLPEHTDWLFARLQDENLQLLYPHGFPASTQPSSVQASRTCASTSLRSLVSLLC